MSDTRAEPLGQSPAELLQIRLRKTWVAGERERRSAIELDLDTPAEDDAAHPGSATARGDLARRLAFRRRGVNLPLPRDDQVVLHDERIEVEEVENGRRSGNELSAKRRKRRAEAPGRTRPGQLRVRTKLLDRRQPALEDRDILLRRALLRSEKPRGVGEFRPHVAEGDRGHRELVHDLPQPGSSVDGRDTPEREHERDG